MELIEELAEGVDLGKGIAQTPVKAFVSSMLTSLFTKSKHLHRRARISPRRGSGCRASKGVRMAAITSTMTLAYTFSRFKWCTHCSTR